MQAAGSPESGMSLRENPTDPVSSRALRAVPPGRLEEGIVSGPKQAEEVGGLSMGHSRLRGLKGRPLSCNRFTSLSFSLNTSSHAKYHGW